jgi:DNA-binding LacI/PurR family transcriptional regulator
LVHHLVGLGHREIAYVHGEAMPPASLRLEGYLRAVRAALLDEDVLWFSGPDYTEETGAAAGRQLLARPRLPTAVVAGNDQQAVGLMQVLFRSGVAVPTDVSVTGFDDSRLAQLSSVDLTTARQDAHLLGEAAVAASIRRIDRPVLPPGLTVVAASLVVRSSSGQPRLVTAQARDA